MKKKSTYVLPKERKEDALRIASLFACDGWLIPVSLTAMLWESYSKSVGEEWLKLPEFDEQLWAVIKEYLWG